jgi:fructoselysine-6-P-deglycase FrlB-like protein
MSITYDEIHDTIPSLRKTTDLLKSGFPRIKKLLVENSDSSIMYIGCGSSLSVAQSLSFMTSTMMNRKSMAVAGGELLVHTDRYKLFAEDSIIIVVSRSGKTSEIINAVEKLKIDGVKFRLVTYCCSTDSPLTTWSDVFFEMPWAYDQSVCQTRTVTNLYYCGTFLISQYVQDLKLIDDLEITVSNCQNFIEKYETECKRVSELNWNHAVVLGDAEISGISQEASLAYKEICQLPSNFYNLLDSRHGPIVLFNGNTLAVIAVSDVKSKLELDLVADVLKKGAKVIVYSDEPLKMDNVINFVFGRRIHQAARGIPFILINQLIALYKSHQTKADPDKPEGLDPWIKI